jgi:DNA helicase-2/ATP-dependent DNA helicase PcrA
LAHGPRGAGGEPRVEPQGVAKEARHLRLLRRGAQIESRFAEAWRAYGAYRDARALLGAAIVQDQFAATTRPHLGVTVMTIHKAKGKEFDAVIVFEGVYQSFLHQRGGDPESASFNPHVAATRARIAVTFMTPAQNLCRLLP